MIHGYWDGFDLNADCRFGERYGVDHRVRALACTEQFRAMAFSRS
jgi:hypothetical protein